MNIGEGQNPRKLPLYLIVGRGGERQRGREGEGKSRRVLRRKSKIEREREPCARVGDPSKHNSRNNYGFTQFVVTAPVMVITDSVKVLEETYAGVIKERHKILRDSAAPVPGAPGQ